MKLQLLFALLFLALLGCATGPDSMDAYADSELEENDEDSIDSSLMTAQRQAILRLQEGLGQAETDGKSDFQQEVEKEEAQEDEAEVVHKYVMQTKSDHPKVAKWIQYYSVKDRERFQRFLNRGARYKQIIQDLLVTNGLPPDLYYLGILESGYVTEAVSHAGAVGPWQFMGPTGRQYGLKINNYVDERIDPIRSTMAAIRYLKELYRQKKSWYMALAAYNAGPGRVRRAMRRGRSRDYWHLTRRRLLPYDTREYIPQFLAILTIGKQPEKFGFVEKAEEIMAPMELVKLPSPMSLKKVAEVSGYDIETLKELNPHLVKGMTPPTKSKEYPLWILKTQSTQVAATYDQLKPFRIEGLRVQSVASRRGSVHRVRRGQNLSTIARRYGTSVRQIKRMNGLRSNRIYIGQRLRVRGRSVASTTPKSVHRVSRGQNLSTIARRYGMSTRQLKSWNNLRSNRIYVGQKLNVRAPNNTIRKTVAVPRTYRVRRGDNLTAIAKKFGTTVGNLKQKNDLSSGKIFVGQKLQLRPEIAKTKIKKYRIRRGDNLYKIARKFGTTIRHLKRINNLTSNQIMRGQVLIVASNP